MKQQIFFLFLLLFGNSAFAQYKYPVTKTVDSTDTWHNVTVKDPYRWLEDLKKPDVVNWYKAQANLTNSILAKLPYTTMLLSEYIKYDMAKPEQKFAVSQVDNSIVYFQLNENDGKYHFIRKHNKTNTIEVIATPEMWGENYRIVDFAIAPNRQYIAIYAQEGGKEINNVKIYSVAEKKILPDTVKGSFKGFMKNKKATFYYLQLPSYDPHIQVNPSDYVFKEHIIGTDATSDKILTSKETNPEIMNIEDGRYIWEIQTFPNCVFEFAWRVQGAYAEIWYRNPTINPKWKKHFDASDIVYNIFYYNNSIYFSSLKDAPNGTIKMLELNNLTAQPKTILAEQADALDYFSIVQTKNYLIAPFNKNGITTYSKFIHLPTHKITASPFKEHTASTRYFGIGRNNNDSLLITRSGWIDYPQTTSASIGNNKEIPYKYSHNQTLSFTDNLMVEELEIKSYDGTLVPVTIIRRKDIKLNGNNVALIHGYGAYGEVLSPNLNLDIAILANKGVVVCIAHVRGGGEKGHNWHIGGMKQSKPNTWKDFNACAEYLIEKGYTSAKHLACQGGSAGGVLIGRAITERPDLWACAIIDVGALNVLRMEYSASGKSQTDEFGSVENINDFFALLESDALLHIQKGTKYPAMLITTGWDDPRVSAWQSGKFVAKAQNATASIKPILLKVNFTGGHFGDLTDNQSKTKENAEKYAFMLEQCSFETANK